MENLSSKWLLSKIGGREGLVKVVQAVEDVCDFSNIAERARASSVQLAEGETLKLRLASNGDPIFQEWWVRFVRDLSKPRNITFMSYAHGDDNIQLSFRDPGDWQTIALNVHNYSPLIAVGRKDGEPFIRPKFYATEEEYLRMVPQRPLAGGLFDRKKAMEDYGFEKSMWRLLGKQFLIDPLGYLERYEDGAAIFNNGLMSVDECTAYLEITEEVKFESRRERITKWRRGDPYPQFRVRSTTNPSLRGCGNTEGRSLEFIQFGAEGIRHTLSTPALVFKSTDMARPVGSILIVTEQFRHGSDGKIEESVCSGHLSIDQYSSALAKIDSQREAESRELSNVIM